MSAFDPAGSDLDHPDPAFPSLHVRPPKGWLNDPNGLSYVDGVYHAFFQYNPDSARHGSIAWGHASSPDLLTWTDEPVAFGPRPGRPDAFGCWSGSVTIDDDVPTAVYSGVLDTGGDSSVLLARSDRRMRDWVQEDEPVARMPEEMVAIRDPFILDAFGHRWSVQSGQLADGRAAVVVHSCDDLHDWHYHGVLLAGDHPVASRFAAATIWECPQLFEVDGTWVLMLSPLVGEAHPLTFERVCWLVGELRLDEGSLRFEPTGGGTLDTGPDLYAPQVLVLPDRVLTFGWIWEDGRTQAEVDAAGWAGTLSFPRELRVRDGVLLSTPARELEQLRMEVLHEGTAEDGVVLEARAFEVEVPPGVAEDEPVRLDLRGADGAARTAVELEIPEGAGARVLVDGSVVEAFVAGEPNRSSRAYPAAGDRWVLTTEMPVKAWRLGLLPASLE